MNTQSRHARSALLLFGAVGLAATTEAQVSFSIDWHSATVGVPDSCGGFPITEADILVSAPGGVPAFGPLPPPCNMISGGIGGLGLVGHPGCVGHLGGTICRIEVDALSYGTDHLMDDIVVIGSSEFVFSTDEFAVGGVPPIHFPGLTSEAPCGDSSADVWRQAGVMPPGPLPPFAAPVGHIGLVDGDGLASCSGAVYPGTGLIEPNFPGFPNTGDNLDALDIDQSTTIVGFPPTGVFFSLDAVFIDPITGTPNAGSALGHGFSSASVLWSPAPGGPPVVFAPAPMLGLDFAGTGQDDLDALALWENGSGAFEPSLQPYDWLGGGRDMLLFSVRRGSAVIGMPDSIFGIPISEGDILTTPLAPAFGGVSPFPGIFCAGENLGLTVRIAGAVDDDLNALDVLKVIFVDCNGNGVNDALDISGGTSTDINGNGIPDECEIIGGPYCYCPAAVAPCFNPDATAGCRNSTGVGGLLSGSGSGSVGLDNLVLTATQLPTFKFGIFFGGPVMVGPFPFGDGLRCVGGGITRFTGPMNSGATGTLVAGPGLAGGFGILPFTTMNFQCWYRDPAGPCGSGFNTTNAFGLTFTP